MSCPHCQGLEGLFDHKNAQKELKHYRKKGPAKSTQLLIEALKSKEITGLTLLDIGGGIGAIQHALLQAGARQVTAVDASSAYLNAAQTEAGRQGFAGRTSYHFGDFVDLAADLPASDIITLDRAICCYPDMPALVGQSVTKAEKFYGLVYPRDSWWMKLAAKAINLTFWLKRSPYRFFIHSSEAVDKVIRERNLARIFYRRTFLWQVVVYER